MSNSSNGLSLKLDTKYQDKINCLLQITKHKDIEKCGIEVIQIPVNKDSIPKVAEKQVVIQEEPKYDEE